LSSFQTGVRIKGQVRDAITISTGVNKQVVILARNNSPLLYLELKK